MYVFICVRDLHAEFVLGRAELCQERPTTKEKEPMDHEIELFALAHGLPPDSGL